MRSLGPAFSQGVVDEEIQGPIYNKLIQYTPGSEWGWQLDAAAMIEQPDPTHIKFALRDDICFTNGFGAITAEDVKFSFERIVDEQLESTNKPDWGPLDHVDVTGEREGMIVLKKAFQPLWSITLPYITGNILSKKAFEQAGGKIATEVVATSGPYMHKSWEPKQKTTLVRNPYWQGEPPAFEEGPTEAVFDSPRHPYALALLAANPEPDPDAVLTRIELVGEPPSLLNRPSGCEFHPRCPFVRERCSSDVPELKPSDHERAHKCH